MGDLRHTECSDLAESKLVWYICNHKNNVPSQLSPKWPVLTLKMRELRHWPSIAGMSPQSHCGDEEDGRIGLSSWRHYMYVLCSLLCACWALCVSWTNFCEIRALCVSWINYDYLSRSKKMVSYDHTGPISIPYDDWEGWWFEHSVS